MIHPNNTPKLQSSTHLQTKLHISTYYYTCQHKTMPHPPQEGSNRSLAYSTLLGVLWQMCHAWITYGEGQKDCPDDKQIMWSKKEITRSIPHHMLLEALWQSCHAWITHRTICRVLLVTTDHITHGTISHVFCNLFSGYLPEALSCLLLLMDHTHP